MGRFWAAVPPGENRIDYESVFVKKYLMKNSVARLMAGCAFCVFFFSCASSPGPMSREFASAPSLEAMDAEFPAYTEERMIAYSVSLTLDVKDARAARTVLMEQTKIHTGFITRETETYVTARIPAKNMDTFLAEARKLGRVEQESRTGTDITDSYRDDTLRLDSLKNIRGRYQALLEKANTVTDMLYIEKEIERLNTQIEVLEGRKRYAEQSVSYADIYISFEKPSRPGPVGWLFYGLYRGIKWLFIWE
jgi:hypothetical protein